MNRRLAAVSVAIAVGLLVSCSTSRAGHGSPPVRSAADSSTVSVGPVGSAPAPPTAAAGGCPATYAAPDPNRPRVTLIFAVSSDLSTVHGSEHISFTPDLAITELVFRLTANTAPTFDEGNQIHVGTASADHGGSAPTYSTDGAAPASQGGLLHIPFAHQIAAGTTVTADMTFTLELGARAFDRFGRTDGYAWFASAHPLLAWERGFGWHDEPMIQFAAESATSEAMQTDLTVSAPAADTVIMSGDPQNGADTGGGMKSWHSTIGAARDVSVAVGPFSVSDTVVNGIKLRLGAYSAPLRDSLVPEFQRAITALSALLGPFPFPSLSVARLPSQSGGIEYPSSILMLDGSRLVAVHETAHQWFYAMVGDSQALHAWLDEAFASYAEQQVNNDPPPPADLDSPGQIDKPTASYDRNEDGYYFVTYDKGAAALHAARAAAGPAAWDHAIRCYVAANAWRIADPPDLAAQLRDLPAALAVLRKAQALP